MPPTFAKTRTAKVGQPPVCSQKDSNRTIRIQVKLQRTQNGEPVVRKGIYSTGAYIVEIQKTRTGQKRQAQSWQAGSKESGNAESELTRPYQFGDFDILAVNMQPSQKDWARFMFTVGNWLAPRPKPNAKLMKIMQPISPTRTDLWTDNIEECIEWFLSGNKGLIFDFDGFEQRLSAAREAARKQKIVDLESARQKRLAERLAKKAERTSKKLL